MVKWKRLTAGVCSAAMLAALLGGCGEASAEIGEAVIPLAAAQDLHELAELPDGGVPLAPANPVVDGVLRPEAPGTVVYGNTYASVDASNADQGYLMVCYQPGETARIKAQVTRSGGVTYTYNLAADGAYDVLPLTQGDGTYQVNIYRNVGGTRYALVFGQSVSVELADPLLPFLYPNQYVDFDENSTVVARAALLCADAGDELDKVSAVYHDVIGAISYDYELAKTVSSTYLPDVDAVLARGKGICFDYAAVMTAMLRAEGIPAKLVVGYTSRGEYHAWISVHISKVGWIDNVISFNGTSWKLMDPTFASTGKSSREILDFINDPANYTEKYCY